MTGHAPPLAAPLSWAGVIRLGVVQAALGAMVVLVISTLNRVMIVEYALPAVVPGLLVALHYAVQMIRPRFGYGSDVSSQRTGWIAAGLAMLAAGVILCAFATVSLTGHRWFALALAVAGYGLVGLGVGAAGTSLLVLLARRVDERKRAAAATLLWVFMIGGFAVCSALVARFLDPFSPRRLVMVATCAAGGALLVGLAALWRIDVGASRGTAQVRRRVPFAQVLQSVWLDPQARRFTWFVFISMLAYSAQEILLEPFAGLVFGYTVGASAMLSGIWHGAALAGMIGVGVLCSGKRRAKWLRAFTIGGCCASAAALLNLVCADLVGPGWPIRLSVVALGAADGVFAVSAIGSMMQLAHQGAVGNAGVRLGLWGASQAVAFAVGGIAAAGIVDSSRKLWGSADAAFAIVFSAQAFLFLIAAWFAFQAGPKPQSNPTVLAAEAIA